MTPLGMAGSSHSTNTVLELTGRVWTFLGGLPGTGNTTQHLQSCTITTHTQQTQHMHFHEHKKNGYSQISDTNRAFT